MNKKTVLITGCSSGLGIYIADKFEKEGHTVIRHKGKKHFDLSSVEEIKKLVENCREHKIDVLINNAAIGCPSKLFSKYSVQEINYMINVNLRAPILLSFLLKDNLTNIININSMVGLEVKKNRTLYSATKWGLRGFSNSLKAENSDLCILDVYPTNIKTTPDRQNAMDVEMVVEKIYQSFLKRDNELILDGRKK